MNIARPRLALVFGAVVITALALSACGRKGPLDLPPSAAAPPGTPGGPAPAASVDPSLNPQAAAAAAQATAQANAVKEGFDSHGNPVAPPGEKKPFFLDPLLQ